MLGGFDRAFFMDGVEMDVAAIEAEEKHSESGEALSSLSPGASKGFSNLQAARREMEVRRELERQSERERSERSPWSRSSRSHSPVDTSPRLVDDDEDEDDGISPTIYNKFSEINVDFGDIGDNGGSDLMKQLWQEEQRKAQAYVKGMKDALPRDDEEDEKPKLPNEEEFEGEVDPEALIPEDAAVPKMDNNYYTEVDSFLRSGPPPTVAGKSGGSKKKSDVEVARAVMGGTRSNKVAKTSTKKVLAAARVGTKSASTTVTASRRAGPGAGVGAFKGSTSKIGPAGPIDEKLLHEAFDYVNEVVVRSSQEDAEEAEQAAQKAREDAFRKQEIKMAHRAGARAGAGAGAKGRPSENQQDGLGGGKMRNSGARSAPLARKENAEGGNARASSSGSGGKDSSMVKRLRNQAAAYADNDRNPSSSATGRNVNSVRGSAAGTLSSRKQGGGAAIGGMKKKGPVGKAIDYGSSNVFDSRAQGSFDTSADDKEGYGNAGGNYNRSSYKGNASGSGLREGAKTALDMKALVTNFEKGDGVAKLRMELEKSQRSMKQSEDFARQAMMEANFR